MVKKQVSEEQMAPWLGRKGQGPEGNMLEDVFLTQEKCEVGHVISWLETPGSLAGLRADP